MHRKRLKLRTKLTKVIKERPKEYYGLRFWWLHEIRQLRAKRRIAGLNTKSQVKAAQRALAKLRDTHRDASRIL
jgi:hypothetical protein